MINLSFLLLVARLLLPGYYEDKNSDPKIVYDGTAYIKIVASSVIDSINFETNFVSYYPLRGCIVQKFVIKKNGTYFLQIKMTKPELVTFIIKKSFDTYLIPNDTLTIQLKQNAIDKDNHSTDYVINNKFFDYCQAKFKKFGYVSFNDPKNKAINRGLIADITQKEYNTGIDLLNAEEKQNISFLEGFNDLPKWFINLERSNIQYSSAWWRFELYRVLTSMSQKEKFSLNLPFYNPDARLSSFYYFFLDSYILYGEGLKNNETRLERMMRILTEQYPKIDSMLKGEIKNYLITCYIGNLYSLCQNEKEVNSIVLFIKSNNFNLTSKETEYLDKERLNISNRLLFLSNLKTGSEAPDFNLKDSNGTSHKLSDYIGKIVYLHFWATWCGPCISELPELNKLISNFDKDKIVFINVCLDNSVEGWKKIVNDKKLQGINLICDGNWESTITYSFRISTIPHYTLVTEKGLIFKNGCDGPNTISNEIRRLLKNK